MVNPVEDDVAGVDGHRGLSVAIFTRAAVVAVGQVLVQGDAADGDGAGDDARSVLLRGE